MEEFILQKVYREQPTVLDDGVYEMQIISSEKKRTYSDLELVQLVWEVISSDQKGHRVEDNYWLSGERDQVTKQKERLTRLHDTLCGKEHSVIKLPELIHKKAFVKIKKAAVKTGGYKNFVNAVSLEQKPSQEIHKRPPLPQNPVREETSFPDERFPF